MPAVIQRNESHDGFKDLAEIHAARNAQRIQHNVHWSPVRQVGHVLNGKDAADDSFVAVPTGHFVADGDFSALCHIDLHRTQHT